MPERLAASDGSLFAVIAAGQLLAESPDLRSWSPILPKTPGINAFTSVK